MIQIRRPVFQHYSTLHLTYLGFLVSTILVGASIVRGDDLASYYPLEKMAKLTLSNRAQCALFSSEPTSSLFILGDSFSAGRLAHSLFLQSMGMGENLSSIEKERELAMREFRESVSDLFDFITREILTQKLPLLPTHEKISQEKLHQLITNIWNIRQSYSSVDSKVKEKKKDKNKEILFKRQIFQETGLGLDSFFPVSLPLENHCQILKKFSALQMNLHTSEATIKSLESLAQALENRSEYVDTCRTQDPNISSRYFIFQMDLGPKKSPDWTEQMKSEWKNKGFIFWSSVKTYFSWAWRNSDLWKSSEWDLDSLKTTRLRKYAHILKSIDLEDSLIWVSNGCQSLRPPQCDKETINYNSLRELAKSEISDTEHDKWVPKGQEELLLTRGARSVNDDFLATLGADSASSWVKQWSHNFTDQRWVMRNKLYFAIKNFHQMAKMAAAREWVRNAREFIHSKINEKPVIDEAAQMCLEWNLSANSNYPFLYPHILNIPELAAMNNSYSFSFFQFTNQQIISYFKEMGEELGRLCDSLEKQHLFSDPDWSELSPWAKEMTQKTMSHETQQDLHQTNSKQRTSNGAVFVGPVTKASLPSSQEKNTCKEESPLSCIRSFLKSTVDLHYVSTFADGFLPQVNTTKLITSEMFNPYSELNACGIYDPWFIKDRARKKFLIDLTSSLLFGVAPVPIYVNIDIKEKKVTSFEKLIENGQVKFNPQYDSKSILYSLILDLGPYFGTPCFIQIDPSGDAQNVNFYVYQGLSVQYCGGNMTLNASIDKPMSFDNKYSVCGACSIHLSGWSEGVSHFTPLLNGVNPMKLGIYLFRSIYRLSESLNDQLNIPDFSTIHPEVVLRTYLENGNRIPERCLEPLSKGLSCLQDLCSSQVAKAFELQFDDKVKTISSYIETPENHLYSDFRTFEIMANQCASPISIRVSCAELQNAQSLEGLPFRLSDSNCYRNSIKSPFSNILQHEYSLNLRTDIHSNFGIVE